MADPTKFGWVQVHRDGPCVDPFDKGPHMCDEDGGIVNVRGESNPDAPIMCVPCYERLRGEPEPQGPWS